MANQEQLARLKHGIEGWNQWRNKHAARQLDLSGADLSHTQLSEANLMRADLRGANLKGANLSRAKLSLAYLRGADLTETILFGADLSRARLSEATLSCTQLSETNLFAADLSEADLWRASLGRADLWGANLSEADLRCADLSEANLSRADLYRANLTGANLSRADLSLAILREADLNQTDLRQATLREVDLRGATLLGANLCGATLTGSSIHGIFIWSVQLEGATQDNLVITQESEPTITIDQLEVAQFISLLLNSTTIHDIIDTTSKKIVLIVGCFTPDRHAILNTIRETLRHKGYLPIVLDADKPASPNTTRKVKTLAHLSRFLLIDLTGLSSIAHELEDIIPTLALPVQPILQTGKSDNVMLVDPVRKSPWVLPILYYTDQAHLLAALNQHVIEPAEKKVQQ